MTVKNNPKHVPHFALIPIRGGPNVADSRQRKPVFRQGYFDAHILVPVKGKEMIDNSEIAGWLTIAMYAHALIDGREVVQHFVGLIYFFFEKAEQTVHAIFRYPNSRYVVVRLLRHDGSAKRIADFLRNGTGGDHTWSGSLRVVAFCRVGRIKSRTEGRGARIVSCGPTTQLSGRCSVPIAFCNNSSPSRKASGRGGQPGT